MTRLTSDTALREIFHTYMRPNKSTMIIATVKVTIRAILKLNPRRTKVTTKIAAERKGKHCVKHFSRQPKQGLQKVLCSCPVQVKFPAGQVHATFQSYFFPMGKGRSKLSVHLIIIKNLFKVIPLKSNLH